MLGLLRRCEGPIAVGQRDDIGLFDAERTAGRPVRVEPPFDFSWTPAPALSM